MFSATVTLSLANTAYNLKDLVSGVRGSCPTQTRGVLIQAVSSNAASLLVGDSSVSSSSCGAELAPGNMVLFHLGEGRIRLDKIYLLSTQANQKANVAILE